MIRANKYFKIANTKTETWDREIIWNDKRPQENKQYWEIQNSGYVWGKWKTNTNSNFWNMVE